MMVPILFIGGIGILLFRIARNAPSPAPSNNAVTKSGTPQLQRIPPQARIPPARGGAALVGKQIITTTKIIGGHEVTTTRVQSAPLQNRSTSWLNRKVTESDFTAKSKAQLDIMRNEIFARHGFIFARRDLAEYFRLQSWYRPRTRDQDLVWNELSPIEQYNIQFIQNYERRR
jgi:hypothetical protein